MLARENGFYSPFRKRAFLELNICNIKFYVTDVSPILKSSFALMFCSKIASRNQLVKTAISCAPSLNLERF